MGKAEMFHNDLYSTGIHSSKLVNTRYIYGNDGLNDTLSRLDRIRLENLDVLFEGDKGIGDSLVCPASATIGEQDNANIAREYTGNHMYFSSPGFAIEYIID